MPTLVELPWMTNFNETGTLAEYKSEFPVSSGADALYSGKGRVYDLALGTSNSETTRFDVPTALARIITGWSVAMYSAATLTDSPLIEFHDGGTVQCYLRQNADGTFSFYRAGGTLLAGPTTGVIGNRASGASHYTYIDCDVTIHNTAGAFHIDIYTDSGVETLSGTGVNTRGGTANNQATGVNIRGEGNSLTLVWGDGYITDPSQPAPCNALLGPGKVYHDAPSADGAHTDWAANTGTRHAAVADTTQDGDSTYISDGAVGDKCSFVFPAVTPTVGSVKFASVGYVARRDDATARTVTAEARVGGTDYDASAADSMTSSYVRAERPFVHNPATGNPWSISELNAAEFGVKVAS